MLVSIMPSRFQVLIIKLVLIFYLGTEKQGGDGRQGGSRRDHGHTTRVSTAVIILFSLARMFL